MCLDLKTRARYVSLIRSRLSEKRFLHCLGTEEAAIRLAQRYGAPVGAAQTAALLHDYAKNLTDQEFLNEAQRFQIPIGSAARQTPDLLHGPVAARLIEESLGIREKDVLLAVSNHTTGRAEMTTLEKIIYLADLIEPSRSYPGLGELREAAFRSLDEGMLLGLRRTIEYVTERGRPLDEGSLAAYQSLQNIMRRNELATKQI